MTARGNIHGESGSRSGYSMQQRCQTLWNMHEALKALVNGHPMVMTDGTGALLHCTRRNVNTEW